MRTASAALVVLLMPSAYADVVDVSSTTMLSGRVEARNGQTYRLVPTYELVTLVARDIQNPVAQDLQLVVSGWGELDMGPNLRWDNGGVKGSRLGGDLDVAYVQGELLNRVLQLRLGRQLIAGGAARVVQLDGAQVLFRAPIQGPVNVGVSGYVGTPVTARFSGWNGETTLGPTRGNLAAGGRVFAQLPRHGELGVSLAFESDHGDPSRRDLGADLKLHPLPWLTFLTSGFYSLYEQRVGEVDVSATAQPVKRLQVTADYRFLQPDLFLARDSILAAFASGQRNQLGVIVTYGPVEKVTLDADYHYLLEDGGRHGHKGRLSGRWRALRILTVGGEFFVLDTPANTYVGGRLFGGCAIQRFSFTADVQDYRFREEVNQRRNSFLTTLSAGYQIASDWRALLAATTGNTPYLESHLDVMAKLVFTPSFNSREVR